MLVVTTTFDLWMSMGAYDVFALVVNFINVDWTPKHAMIKLFQAIETMKQTVVLKFQAFFNKYDLRVKIFTYVKDEGVNSNAMITILKLVVSCQNLGLKDAFQGTCFGHTMSKVCQYGTMDDKVSIGLHEVSIKLGQNDVQIALHGPRSLGNAAKSGQRLVLIWFVTMKIVHPYQNILFHFIFIMNFVKFSTCYKNKTC
jgi:hypothetical protein